MPASDASVALVRGAWADGQDQTLNCHSHPGLVWEIILDAVHDGASRQ